MLWANFYSILIKQISSKFEVKRIRTGSLLLNFPKLRFCRLIKLNSVIQVGLKIA